MSQRVATCRRALQCVVVYCSVLQRVAACLSVLQCVAVCYSVLQCVAVCCSVLQCVAVCCSVLQRVAVCCSLLALGDIIIAVWQHKDVSVCLLRMLPEILNSFRKGIWRFMDSVGT